MFKAKEYVRVRSLQEAYDLNQKRSSLVVGGMMWLKMENINKQTVIDLSGLGLNTIEETPDGFSIGAMCTLRQLETHAGLNSCFQDVWKECTRHIVGVQFRNMATVGGSIYGRYGFSDILTCMMALDTCVELYHGGIVSLETFSRMPYDNDILVRIFIKKDGRKVGYASQRMTKTDFPLIACAVAKTEDNWHICIGARPSRAGLVTLPLDSGDDISRLAKEAAGQFRYGTNLRGSKEYRSEIAKILTGRLMESL